MMFSTAFLSALLASASFVSAAPAPASPVENIVFNPMITYPTAGVVWTPGESRTITWNTADVPAEEVNSTGTILLGFNENDSENLNIANPLATGFKIMDGKVNVTVPQTQDRDDYIVVLFGDSGNASPEFSIKSSSASASVSASASSSLPTAPASTSAASSSGLSL